MANPPVKLSSLEADIVRLARDNFGQSYRVPWTPNEEAIVGLALNNGRIKGHLEKCRTAWLTLMRKKIGPRHRTLEAVVAKARRMSEKSRPRSEVVKFVKEMKA